MTHSRETTSMAPRRRTEQSSRRDPTTSRLGKGLQASTLLRRTAGVELDAARSAAEGTDDVAAHTVAADLELLAGQVTECFDRLIALVRRTSDADREMTKDHLLELLDLVGNEDPRVLAARRSLANALF